ncbi:hypothetical protein [Arthrobacter sp. MAHUQ-56]
MRASQPLTETDRIHHFPEGLMTQFARGREWATPGVQAALQRAVAGLDAGIETASPRLQVLLRRLADELAGGVETLTPRVRKQLKRAGKKTPARRTRAVPVRPERQGPGMWWWIVAIAALAAGAAVWRARLASQHEPAPTPNNQETGDTDRYGDADLTAGRM